MTRHVRSDVAFTPANVARRMRTGLWVTATFQEVTPADLDDRHLRQLRAWLDENATLYAAILLIHPDSPAPERRNGGWVRRTNLRLSCLSPGVAFGRPHGNASSVLHDTKLYKDIVKEMRHRGVQAEREARRTFFEVPTVATPAHDWGHSADAAGVGVDVGDPRTTGDPLILKLDNGDQVIVTGTHVTVRPANASSDVIVGRG